MIRSVTAAKSALLGAAAAAMLAATPAEAATRDFIGTWVNTDRGTDGMTRLVISRRGRGALRVQGFGQCTPRDCDWGTTRLTLYAPSASDSVNRNARRGTANFRQSFKRTLLTLTLVNDNTMRFCTYNNFTDRRGRSDYYSCGRLRKRSRARPGRGRGGRPETFSTGKLTIPQTHLADLDEGDVTRDGADIWFRARTETARFVAPRNGARIAIAGRRSVGRDGCRRQDLSGDPINIRRLPPGTYVCVRTNEGRISQFRVNARVGRSPGELEIGYTTWKKRGD
ncbi:MAG: hypothetical protein ACLFWF_15100 [Alphaproteobacteria bacterium]